MRTQATPNVGLWRVQKRSGQFWEIHLPIPTWNKGIYQETWKDLKWTIQTKFVFII